MMKPEVRFRCSLGLLFLGHTDIGALPVALRPTSGFGACGRFSLGVLATGFAECAMAFDVVAAFTNASFFAFSSPYCPIQCSSVRLLTVGTRMVRSSQCVASPDDK